jgi:hypothetical protein
MFAELLIPQASEAGELVQRIAASNDHRRDCREILEATGVIDVSERRNS